MKKKRMNGLKWLLAFLIAIALISSFAPFSVLNPGAEAPLTGEVVLGIKGRELTVGSPVKVLAGEVLTASFSGEWFNRSESVFGNSNAAGFWVVDGELLDLAVGPGRGVNSDYVTGTNPDAGVIAKEVWVWQTLPIIATLPSSGNTVGIEKSFEFDTSGLEKGVHQVQFKAGLINGSGSSDSIFRCSDPMGACCPLQTFSQGFPCQGIYGSTTSFSRSSSPVCPSVGTFGGKDSYLCSTGDELACRTLCCERAYCGDGYCSGVAPGQVFWMPSGYSVACDVGPRLTWSDFGEGFVDPAEDVSKDQAVGNVFGNSVVVGLAEFEVVESCPNECCVNQDGYRDLFCLGGDVCSSGVCVTPVEECPFECCDEGDSYEERSCSAGFECVENQCIVPVEECPFECCESLSGFEDKACLVLGAECVDNSCQVEQSLSIFDLVFSFINNFFKHFLSLLGL